MGPLAPVFGNGEKDQVDDNSGNQLSEEQQLNLWQQEMMKTRMMNPQKSQIIKKQIKKVSSEMSEISNLQGHLAVVKTKNVVKRISSRMQKGKEEQVLYTIAEQEVDDKAFFSNQALKIDKNNEIKKLPRKVFKKNSQFQLSQLTGSDENSQKQLFVKGSGRISKQTEAQGSMRQHAKWELKYVASMGNSGAAVSDNVEVTSENFNDYMPNMPTQQQQDIVSIPIKCSFKSLYEDVFDKILQMDDISQKTLIDSLDVEFNNDQVFQAGEGAGASGSFFFFSYDQKFIIKTLKDGEMKLMEKFIHSYLNYLMKNPNSLLARIYGLFKIKTKYFDQLYVMIMQNTFQSTQNADCTLKFDLKGSRVGRKAKSLLSDIQMQKCNASKTEDSFLEAF